MVLSGSAKWYLVVRRSGLTPAGTFPTGGALLPHDADTKAEALFNQLLEGAHVERTSSESDRGGSGGGEGSVSGGGARLDPSLAVAGTPLLVQHGPAERDAWFPAKIVEVKRKSALIHYDRCAEPPRNHRATTA